MEQQCKTWRPVSHYCDTNEALPTEKVEPWTNIKIADCWPEWHEHAACFNEGLEKYFGTDSDIRPTMSTRQVREAQQTCFTCPVLAQCLDWALSCKEEYGVWGGTSGRTRRRIWRWIKDGYVTQEQVIADISDGKVGLYEHDLDDEEEAV
jgi:WhiB family redox-sensing transcriptional regulator